MAFLLVALTGRGACVLLLSSTMWIDWSEHFPPRLKLKPHLLMLICCWCVWHKLESSINSSLPARMGERSTYPTPLKSALFLGTLLTKCLGHEYFAQWNFVSKPLSHIGDMPAATWGKNHWNWWVQFSAWGHNPTEGSCFCLSFLHVHGSSSEKATSLCLPPPPILHQAHHPWVIPSSKVHKTSPTVCKERLAGGVVNMVDTSRLPKMAQTICTYARGLWQGYYQNLFWHLGNVYWPYLRSRLSKWSASCSRDTRKSSNGCW